MATSVNFDYDGPPVSVSNGMALQLVSQFGICNAWHAFLRMRGRKVNSEEANMTVASLKYFRNKIGRLRHEVRELKGQQFEGGQREEKLLDENFDTFLAENDSLELREGVEEYPGMVEKQQKSADAKRTDHDEASAFSNMPVQSNAVATMEVIRDQRRMPGQSTEVETTDGKEQSVMKVAGKKNDERAAKASWDEAVLGETMGRKQSEQRDEKVTQDGSKEGITRRHAETIGGTEGRAFISELRSLHPPSSPAPVRKSKDDVVALVLEKIRSNQPFEGELGMASAPSATQTHRFSPTIGAASNSHKNKTCGRRRPIATANAHGKNQHKEVNAPEGQIQRHKRQRTVTQQTSRYGPTPSAASQSIVYLHSPKSALQIVSPQFTKAALSVVHQPTGKSDEIQSPMATTILSNLSEVISDSSSNSTHSMWIQQTHADAAIRELAAKHTQSVHCPNEILSQQQQSIGVDQKQQHWLIGGEGSAQLVVNGGGIPLDLAIQRGMTVQQLIQTMNMQNRQQQSIFQQQLPLDQKQQERADSSRSDGAIGEGQKGEEHKSEAEGKGAAKIGNESRKRKELPSAAERGQREQNKTHGERNAPPEAKRQRKKGKQTTPGGWEGEGAPKTAPMGDNKTDEQQRGNTTKLNGTGQSVKMDETAALNQKHEQTKETQQQHIGELEAQLRRAQKQLTIERNKLTGQKKRADKLQTEMDKNLDSVQLLHIDLACLKTDNNNLIAENIALKAENQQLRSRGLMSATGIRRRAVPFPPTAAIGTRGAAEAQKGRKKANCGNGDGEGRNEKFVSLPERTRTPPPLSSELGRRQSKRICVARSQFMKTLY